MSTALDMFTLSPFDALAEYERRSLAHVAGVPEQIEAPGLWRGIGFRIGSRYLVSSINEVNEIVGGIRHADAGARRTQPWLLGVANVRGNLVPLIDLRQYLEGERTLVSEVSRVLLVRQSGGSVGLLIDEVLGQRNFSQEQRADAIGEEDERYNRFVPEKYLLGEVYWGLFSMAALVRTPDFAQASA